MRDRKQEAFRQGRDRAEGEQGTKSGPGFLVDFRRRPDWVEGNPNIWELDVRGSHNEYSVIVGALSSQLDVLIQRLPEPNAERQGVMFGRTLVEVILPPDIRRLCGETLLLALVYRVLAAPAGSPYNQGQSFADADLSRPVAATKADKVANERRKEALLRQFEFDMAEGRSLSQQF
ncbi:hypothetical protein FJ546_06050 [Mesorhizobium sp. B2-4-19]|uniref:hypothetical protein n=1 Tax=Mesorhizobium sp. B2-4-19 TaxID=2589930 RepID=UPI00112C805A|nr:hypothetical protein [Mesorhizobium sp. B2-4-19]TPK66334.1 hypothetical protein FJ546_06050 [Mesorhizobium sp. B2-4-19]